MLTFPYIVAFLMVVQLIFVLVSVTTCFAFLIMMILVSRGFMTRTIRRAHRIFALIFASYHFFKNFDSLIKSLLVVTITVRSNLMIMIN